MLWLPAARTNPDGSGNGTNVTYFSTNSTRQLAFLDNLVATGQVEYSPEEGINRFAEWEWMGGTPTVLCSGNGYHLIQPIDATVLENLVELGKLHEKPSEQFLRFAEWHLSHGKADRNHYNALSFGNCLLRIPGSHNSKLVLKNGSVIDEYTKVRVMQEWDGHRPNISLLLGNFHAYLVDQRIKELEKHNQVKFRWSGTFRDNNTIKEIPWIERLLQTPLSNDRKYCIWRILAPYLVNTRKLSDEDALSIIMTWLENCNAVGRLTFNPRKRARYDIRYARRKGSYPLSMNDSQDREHKTQ